MEITIKVLSGKDTTLKVLPTTTILEIKQNIQELLNINVASQKLLFMGHTLNDDQTLAAYPNIKSGSKLNLIVKKEEGLRGVIRKSFRKYYNDQQSECLTKEFMINFEKKMKSFSLDDIERLAGSILCQQENKSLQ